MKLTRVLLGISVVVLMASSLAAGAGAINLLQTASHGTATVTFVHFVTSIAAAARPEPTSLILLGMGGLVLLNIRRRRQAA